MALRLQFCILNSFISIISLHCYSLNKNFFLSPTLCKIPLFLISFLHSYVAETLTTISPQITINQNSICSIGCGTRGRHATSGHLYRAPTPEALQHIFLQQPIRSCFNIQIDCQQVNHAMRKKRPLICH